MVVTLIVELVVVVVSAVIINIYWKNRYNDLEFLLEAEKYEHHQSKMRFYHEVGLLAAEAKASEKKANDFSEGTKIAKQQADNWKLLYHEQVEENQKLAETIAQLLNGGASDAD